MNWRASSRFWNTNIIKGVSHSDDFESRAYVLKIKETTQWGRKGMGVSL